MSMKDAGILDGDLVAVHRTGEIRNRQIIVARLENEVTVKRYRQEGSVVWLLPENAEFEPMRIDLREQSLLIEGVVVGVLRRGEGAVAGRPGSTAASGAEPDYLRLPAVTCGHVRLFAGPRLALARAAAPWQGSPTS